VERRLELRSERRWKKMLSRRELSMSWREIKRALLMRVKGCEVCTLFPQGPLDVHHVVRRSQGGTDDADSNLTALCRSCHDWTAAAFSSYRGRLVIEPAFPGFFHWRVMRAPSKTEARAGRYEVLASGITRKRS
jgi:5-methylcytosine-specific restriction endonuclease McrA